MMSTVSHRKGLSKALCLYKLVPNSDLAEECGNLIHLGSMMITQPTVIDDDMEEDFSWVRADTQIAEPISEIVTG